MILLENGGFYVFLNKLLSFQLFLGIALLPIFNVFSCTGIVLHTKNGEYVYGRTLEFGVDIESQVLFIPRNYKLEASTYETNVPGLTWNSKYAAVGANAFGTLNFVDGVNEKGLAGGLFYFPGFAEYQKVQKSDYEKSIPMWQLLTWILTNFENVQQIKNELSKIYVTDVVFPQFKNSVPAHLLITDSSGKSIVIEYLNGKLELRDNLVGVFTNSPNFDWHLTNLRNYINLSPTNVESKNINSIKLDQLSQGSGLHGIPGDFTSPSRFVRAFEFVQNSPVKTTEQETVYQAFHILNNFDIPEGSVKSKNGESEITLWTSVTDLKNKVFYFKTHSNFDLQKIELSKMDLESKEAKHFSMNSNVKN